MGAFHIVRKSTGRPDVEKVVLELDLEEFFLVSALQYQMLGGKSPFRNSLEKTLDGAWYEIYPEKSKNLLSRHKFYGNHLFVPSDAGLAETVINAAKANGLL